jgi:hypothetical protein
VTPLRKARSRDGFYRYVQRGREEGSSFVSSIHEREMRQLMPSEHHWGRQRRRSESSLGT